MAMLDGVAQQSQKEQLVVLALVADIMTCDR